MTERAAAAAPRQTGTRVVRGRIRLVRGRRGTDRRQRDTRLFLLLGGVHCPFLRHRLALLLA